MTCKDCIHYEVCPLGLAVKGSTGTCLKFKNNADFVEVVRCKDCRMFVDNKEAKVTYCTRECKNITVNEDDFCSYGERKE